MDVSDEENGQIASIWGRLIFFACMATSVIYVLLGLFACRRLICANCRWVLVLALYWVVGMMHAFLSLAILCVAVACIFWTFGSKVMSLIETIAYTGVMVVLTVFFALGRKSILYAL
ncbi:hypothetical protein DQ04_02611050 [Trypanosoma grayi]|uniref:hypothetical protein n=1 Tax=Trypanosoma grayi TaxID=71804 RepID=UPI0004F425BF|nr:hypothetical protein DQ04_02611050 [Trypanosoma grayi]KEG11446.1 hypothetical protein DQ04_02611050 [Trypanosoma grayi]